MNCDTAREAMLVADPGELREGVSATPLATHLASCERCGELARQLVTDLDVLSATIVARAGDGRRKRSVRRVALIAAIPLAAAVVAFAVLGTRDESPVPAPAAAVRPAVSNVVSVDIARGQQATVIRTQDPKVTVIWLTNGGGL